MNPPAMRGIYCRAIFVGAWLALIFVVAHAIAGSTSAQMAYPLAMQSSR
ncbi:MAG TPA: hypothetical protein VHW73_04320 [Rudaea sp.]|jgi:hypothetical protein|nr:hypothetical protein [Rudaea sp.]